MTVCYPISGVSSPISGCDVVMAAFLDSEHQDDDKVSVLVNLCLLCVLDMKIMRHIVVLIVHICLGSSQPFCPQNDQFS